MAIVALVSAALPEALDAGLPEEPAEADEGEEPDLEQLAAELDLDDSWLEVDELAARRELRRQIGRLEAQLASYTRDLETLADAPRRITPPEPRIATAAELERTRDALLRQLAAARAAAARRARRERRAARGPRRDGRRPGGASLGGRLVGRDRRGGLPDLAGRAAPRARSAR